MAGNRTLKLSILADVDDLKKKLGDGGKEVDGFGGKLEKFGKVAAAAFAAAAAAAVAYAGKLAIDGVKAAIEDEAAQLKLANALKNVTGATENQISAVEKQIEKLALATGTADDALRPAFQRLAVATKNVDEAQRLLNIALDVSAATGKPLEAVTNALGKAYEGNTTSLARLGIGMSTADIKAIGLEGTIDKLADTFQGAADVQANSFQGRIERLKVAFDEAKETIGAALLPILDRLLRFITDNVLPIIQKLSDAFSANKDGLNKQFGETVKQIRDFLIPIIEAFRQGIGRIRDAIEDNRERFANYLGTLQEVWAWINKYLVPLFEFILVAHIEKMTRQIEIAIRVLVPVVEFVANAIKFLINSIIERINDFIKAYNLLNGLWGGKDVPLLQKVGDIKSQGDYNALAGVRTPFTGSTSATTGSITGAGVTGGSTGGGVVSGAGATGSSVAGSAKAAAEAATKAAEAVEKLSSPNWMPTFGNSVADFRARESGDIINTSGLVSPGALDVARVTRANNITVVVQAPSAIDEEGFSRAVVDALNQAANRGTGGGGGIRSQAQIL